METLKIINVALAIICLGLFLLNAVLAVQQENISAALGWGCATIWVINWFIKS